MQIPDEPPATASDGRRRRTRTAAQQVAS
jgi:ribonuclease J